MFFARATSSNRRISRTARSRKSPLSGWLSVLRSRASSCSSGAAADTSGEPPMAMLSGASAGARAGPDGGGA